MPRHIIKWSLTGTTTFVAPTQEMALEQLKDDPQTYLTGDEEVSIFSTTTEDPAPIRKAILKAMKDAEPMSERNVADKASLDVETVEHYLHELKSEGFLLQKKVGLRWFICDAGMDKALSLINS